MSEEKKVTISGLSYELGKIAYDAYCGNKNINWKSKFTGADLPSFENNLPEIQDAWAEAAETCLSGVISDFIDALKNDSMQDTMKNAANLLGQIFPNLGFALFIFEFNKAGISNYISNADRENMILALKETLERFEKKETSEIIKNFE